MEELSKVLYEGFGNGGKHWQRLTMLSGELADPIRVVDRLKSGGCGAFKGRQRCGAELKPDCASTIGHSSLLFLSYIAAGPFTLPDSGGGLRSMLAFFCERHQDNLVLDMPRALRRRQEKEQKKFIEMGGRKVWFGF
jgi:hypothetical protein